MHQFTDRHDRTWNVEITVGDLKRLKAEADLDLPKVADDGFEELSAILNDPSRVIEILYVLCSEQADQANVTAHQFGRAFSGDSLMAATKALVGAVIDFFPNPRQRGAMQKLLDKSDQMRDVAADRMDAMLDEIDVEAEVSRLAGRSGSSPASSASTPDP